MKRKGQRIANKEREIIREVGRLFRSNPGVVRVEMARGKDGVYRQVTYRWYRDSWMTHMLNEYEKLLKLRREIAREG